MPITEKYKSRRITLNNGAQAREVELHVDNGDPNLAILDPDVPAIGSTYSAFITGQGDTVPANTVVGLVAQRVRAQRYTPSVSQVFVEFGTESSGSARSRLGVDDGTWEVEFDLSATTRRVFIDSDGEVIYWDAGREDEVYEPGLSIRYRRRVPAPTPGIYQETGRVNAADYTLGGSTFSAYTLLYLGATVDFHAPGDYMETHSFKYQAGETAPSDGFDNDDAPRSGHQYVQHKYDPTNPDVNPEQDEFTQTIRRRYETSDFSSLNLEPGLPPVPEV